MELIKSITALCLLTFSLSLSAQVNWYTFEEAFEAQKVDPKPIMMDAYTVWCGPCKLLDKNTFGNKDVSDYLNANFYPVKFNAEGNEVVRFEGNNSELGRQTLADSGLNIIPGESLVDAVEKAVAAAGGQS